MKKTTNTHRFDKRINNSHKLKITLATDSCSKGNFDKRGVLTPSVEFTYIFDVKQ